MTALRILVLSQYYDPDPIPKPSEVAEQLAARGHHVFVLAGLPNYPSGVLAPGYRLRPLTRETRRGVAVYRVAEIPYHGRSIVRRILNYGSFLMAASVMSFFIPRPDVTYVWHPPLTNGLVAWWGGLRSGAPFLLDVQDIWPDEGIAAGLIREGRLVRFFRRLESFVYRRAARVFVVTEGAKANLAAKGVPPAKLYVSPNWIDPEWFATPTQNALNSARQELAGSNRFIVTFAGNIGYIQGLDVVLRAAALLRDRPEIGFRVIGSGPDLDGLRRQAQEQNLNNIRFLGRRPLPETAVLLRASDVLLVHLRRDPIADVVVPTKTLAYLAVGRPILMAMQGDAAALIEASGSGVAVASDDPHALAEGTLRLFAMTAAELDEMGSRGRAYAAEHYSREKLVNRLESSLLEIATAPAGHSE
jgi:colanic acid biosynthesis glycosyl transferase WcaI